MKKSVPTEQEIVKKHKVSLDYVTRQAEIGSTVEREHVTTHDEAYGIALQHIMEFPDYYKHLLPMENKLKKEWSKKNPIKENIIFDVNEEFENYYEDHCGCDEPKETKKVFSDKCTKTSSGTFCPVHKMKSCPPSDPQKNEIEEAADFWHPDPNQDKKLGGPGANQRAREDRAAESKPKEDPKKLRSGESYMDYAKRTGGYSSSPSKNRSLLGKLLNREHLEVTIDEVNLSFSIDKKKTTGLRSMTKVDAERHSPDAASRHKQERSKVGLPSINTTKEEFEIEEGMTMKDFKSNRRKIQRAAASVDAKKRGHVSKNDVTHGRTYSPDEAKSGRSNMSDNERATRKSVAMNPDQVGDTGETADRTKDPKKLRKQAAMGESAAWTRKAGKSESGGLNEKGRRSYEKQNPGSDLKAPQPEGGSRRDSFCARMKGMKKKLTSAKTANDPDSRINKSLRAWNC